MRRLFRPLTIFTIIATLVAACSPATPTQPAATSAPAVEPTTAPEASAYPVTIDHKFGSTTLTEFPGRIVLVGLNEQDSLLALGVVPIATREWYGERPGAIFEWATDELGDAPVPVVLSSTELSFEQIAGLQPDVIVGLYAGITQEEYDTLSQIAPTIAQPAEYVDWGIPWQEVTRTIGKIVGKSDQAETLVVDTEARFANFRAQHPEFEGATGAVASSWGYPDSYWVYSSQDVRGRFLNLLGFSTPAEADELSGTGFGASISRERLDIVDVDVLVWLAEDTGFDTDPLYQQLAVVPEGRDIFLVPENPLYDALNFSTVLSLNYALDSMVPLLVAAVDGDPATVAAGTEAEPEFPVTINHKYGSTTITEYPERIVLVGLNEQDSLLALGVVPVATREWYGERPGAIFEWAQDELGSAPVPVVLSSSELSFEQIAGLQPDLIVGLYAGLTQDEYDTLAQIAPTVAQPAEYVDWGIPWQEVTRTMGLIVGKTAEAEALVADVEAKISAAREQHPEFIGATGVFASTYGFPDTFWAFSPQDVRGRLLAELGFELPEELVELTSDGYGASISRERLDLLDLDTVVWVIDTDEEAATLKADALYRQLNAAKEGRDVIFTGSNQMYDALNFSTVLSLPYVIDELVPHLAAALDGDPATVATP